MTISRLRPGARSSERRARRTLSFVSAMSPTLRVERSQRLGVAEGVLKVVDRPALAEGLDRRSRRLAKPPVAPGRRGPDRAQRGDSAAGLAQLPVPALAVRAVAGDDRDLDRVGAHLGPHTGR